MGAVRRGNVAGVPEARASLKDLQCPELSLRWRLASGMHTSHAGVRLPAAAGDRQRLAQGSSALAASAREARNAVRRRFPPCHGGLSRPAAPPL